MRTLAGRLIAIVVMALLVSPGPALGHDHRKPRVLLISGRERQKGHPYTWTWTKPSGEFCQVVHADGVADFPRAMAYEAGHRARIRFFKRHRPTRVKIRVHRRVDEDGDPVGESHPVRHHLRRRRVNDRGVWDAVFRRHRIGHHYLYVQARWRDVQGCGGSQELDVLFHLRAQ